MKTSRIIRPLVSFGIASAVLAGGLLVRPHLSDEVLTGAPAAGGSESVSAPSVDVTSSASAAEERVQPASRGKASSTPVAAANGASTGGKAASSTASKSTSTPKPTASKSASSKSTSAALASKRASSARSSAATKSSNTSNANSNKTVSSSSSPASASNSNQSKTEAEVNGWKMDYFDGFDVPIEQTKWERYGWNDPPVGHGAMGVMSQRNSFTKDGKLIIRTQYENGQWSAGGAGSGNIFAASQGRWEVRAKFPRAKGLGYAFLLWPEDGSWPPEINFAEGFANGPEVMGVYHWDPDNKQEHRFFDNNDMNGWHTYGVIVEPTKITFTFDGKPWGSIDHPSVTTKRMWVGFQTGAMDPNGENRDHETVDNGVPGPLTPAVSDIEIDYVAHYTKG